MRFGPGKLFLLLVGRQFAHIVRMRLRVRTDRHQLLRIQLFERLPVHLRMVALLVSDIVGMHEHRGRIVHFLRIG